jgi:DNA-binding winged helix-turn-helix (wHTH) protein
MTPIYAFGAFRLDPAEPLLVRDGRPVSLTPKAFDLLVHLVEHRGRLVEKAMLMAALWPDASADSTGTLRDVSSCSSRAS